MDNFLIRQCNLKDIEKLKYLSEKTFNETFSEENSLENLEEYLQKNFSYEQIEAELKTDGSTFFLVETDREAAAYMKVNFDKAQTEPGHPNTLEVQRIYVLKEYKGKHIGKKLIQKAIEAGKTYDLHYIWLGVWENNIKAIKFYEKQGFIKFDTHIFVLGEEEQTDNLMKLQLN